MALQFSPSPLAGEGDSPKASGVRGALAQQAREPTARPPLQASLSGKPLSFAILPREGGGAKQ
jgi:hypothetical protein